jgi:hypothetical protein
MSFGGNIGHFHPGFIYIYILRQVRAIVILKFFLFCFVFFLIGDSRGKGWQKGPETQGTRLSTSYCVMIYFFFAALFC